MRKGILISLIAAVLTMGAFVFVLQAGSKSKGKAATVEGTLVDSKCYSMGAFLTDAHTVKGKKMPGCATACASMGIPVAIVDEDENVHILAVPAQEYAKWMASEIRVKGMYGKHADVLIPQKLEIKEDGKWVEKELPGTMM
ncbi:MAG: hypothetical protein GWN16_10970 [Calditrichae bacterium]|nr:hypothetical protein [Calditrichia bacterium]NIW79938.1 hypothetical protein [Calditrichia bacterium]